MLLILTHKLKKQPFGTQTADKRKYYKISPATILVSVTFSVCEEDKEATGSPPSSRRIVKALMYLW